MYVDWEISTKQIGACSCDYGCPCEFNAPPTRLPCEGVMAMEITRGHFGDVRLDGLRVAGVYRWPGPVHEGKGTWWSIIDRRATQEQIDALFTIMAGKEQEPTTGFAIYASQSRMNQIPSLPTLSSNGTSKAGRAALSSIMSLKRTSNPSETRSQASHTTSP